MIELKPFGAGLGVIALQLNKPVTGETLRAYWLAFRNETTQAEWEAFTAGAAVRWGKGWQGFVPTVPALFDALREFRGFPSLAPESSRAYDQVLAAGEYTPGAGRVWTFRGVLATCGIAAAEAFLAAGGHSAFATTWDEPKRRERFLAAYQVAASQDPRTRLLPAGPVKAITGDVETEPPVDAGAAAQAMREIRERLGVEPVARKPAEIVATDERLTELRRQAQQITTQEPADAGREV